MSVFFVRSRKWSKESGMSRDKQQNANSNFTCHKYKYNSMKNRIYLIIIAILLPHFVFAQSVGEIIRNEVRDYARSHNRSSDRGSSSSSHSSSSSSQSSSSNSSNNDYYWERQREEWEKQRKEKEREAVVIINKMDQLINNNCIDIKQIQNAIDEFNSLPDDLQNVQGVEGHNARAKLLAQKDNATLIYNKYSLMATNIRELSFGGFNTRLLSLSYEDLDKYLKQFLSKYDFERAKVEYQKYEKAKVLENEIEELYAHWDDKNYLREHSENIQKLKSNIEQQDVLKHVNKYHLCLLEIIEKEVEYDEIQQIPLTVSNIKTTLASKKVTKNNADWKEIAGGMTNQRLLSVLGILNSDNNNILPNFVTEEGGVYLFVGKPTKTDTKIVTKEYLVSKDGSEIKIFETEGVIANDLVEIKATLGDRKASAKLTSDGEFENKVGSTVAKNAAGAKLTLMNTDWHKQDKKDVLSIDTDGSVLQNGEEGSVGLKANVSGSANADINIPIGKKVNNSGSANADNDVHNDKTPIVSGNASVGPEVEVAHYSYTLAGKWTPKMIVNPDGSISYRQYSASVELGASAGASAKYSASEKGVKAKTGVGLSAGVSFDSQDIDGALKQIDSDVVLGIIKSSIDNEYYRSDFDDEAIGKAVVSGIRKEVENY